MRSTSLGIAAIAAGLIALGGPASAQPLRRDLGSYFILASKYVHIKNFSLDSACNIGVNCKAPSASGKCGELVFDDATFADGSQAVGDRTFCTKPGSTLWQLFRNGGGSGCVPPDITLKQPPEQGFLPPILGDLDGDSTPSCGNVCDPDIGDLEVGCGFPAVFPACDPSKGVIVRAGQDCDGAVDTLPGNSRCDLAPGTYGEISVRNFGKLDLAPGSYNVCSLKVGRNALVTAKGTNVFIADGGSFRVGGTSKVGQQCGDLTVLEKGTGRITFGRGATVAAKVCAPAAALNLGHGNLLIGQFVGDTITANRNNHGQCCVGGKCTCFDTFSPTTAHCGDTLTITSGCDLTNATGVKICGISAMILTKSPTQITVKVPVANGPCDVEVDSSTGTFVGTTKLNVNCPS
jgi:hypothetical protein